MPQNVLTTLVYKYNPSANYMILVYIILLFGFFILLYVYGVGLLWFGIVLVGLPIYVAYSKNRLFNLRYADPNKLTLSTDGISYGDEHYCIDQIEAIAIYFESFDGFEYREGFITNSRARSPHVKATGDGNEISFRIGANVTDFTFYLADYAHFCILRSVINDWISANISVVLKQRFADDFILQQMEHYRTPGGL